MRMNVLALGLLLLAGPTHAAPSYPDCVVEAVTRARANVRCNFDDLRTQLPEANRGCRQILIDTFMSSSDRSGLLEQVKAWKEEADQRTSDFLTAEIKSCGAQGEAKVSGSGMQLSLTIIKIR